MNLLKKFNKFTGIIMDNASWILMAALCIVVFYQVVNRELIRHGGAWSEEVAKYLFTWLILAASVCAVRSFKHIAVNIIFQLWPGKVTNIVKVTGDVLSLVYCLFFTCASFVWAYQSKNITTEVLRTPLWLVYMIMPITGFAMSMWQLEHLIEHIKGINLPVKGKGTEEEAK